MENYQEPMLNHALRYASRGWHVFPVHGVTQDRRCGCGKMTCSSPGKHPKTINFSGLHEASEDSAEITRQFNAAGDCNVAIRTGAISGFFVLDIDGPDGEKSLSALESEHGLLPSTLTSLTGNGRHFIFRHPGFFTANSTSKIAHKIDIRGDGGYIVAPPSRHVSGVRYRFENESIAIADAPDWLLGRIASLSAPAHVIDHERLALPDFTPDDIADMLDHIPADDYESWYQIGMALHHDGHDFSVWDAWSSKSAKYTDANDCMMHWRSFKKSGASSTITIGSLVHMAQAGGWVPKTVNNPAMDAMIADLIANERAKKERKIEPAPVMAPEPVLTDSAIPPGLIGDTVAWIVKTAIKPQPELALMNVLAALGSVVGRRYASEWDTRTNLYMIGIAGTGAGKDHSRKQIKKLMAAANLGKFLAGDNVVSDRGILRGLTRSPEQILHLDEVGLLLQCMTGANAAPHMRAVSKVLMEIYSSSSTVYNSGSYASAEVEPIIIESPHLCVYGTTTLESYTEALSRTAVKDGSLNRFIIMPVSDDKPKRSRDVVFTPPPETLLHRWRSIADHMPQGNGDIQALNVSIGGAPKPQIVGWGDTLERIHDMGDFEDERLYSDKANGPLWNRYRENCIKIAMVIAVCRNPLLPIIVHSDLDYAESIVKRSVEFMTSIADDHIADSPFEKQCNAVIGFIRDEGKDGATRSTIMRRSKMKAKDLTDILASLSEAGRIYPSGDKAAYCRWFVNG